MKCQFVSTRCRGIEAVAPMTENDPTEMWGSPPLYGVTPVSKPIDAGLKLWSSGKNPSTKRFQPSRASLTCAELTIFTQESDTSCTVVGVTVLKPGSSPPANCANGKLWLLLP